MAWRLSVPGARAAAEKAAVVPAAVSRQVTLKLVAATRNPAKEHALLLWLHTDADPWSVQSVDGTQGYTQKQFHQARPKEEVGGAAGRDERSPHAGR
jgi:hypothetical protein